MKSLQYKFSSSWAIYLELVLELPVSIYQPMRIYRAEMEKSPSTSATTVMTFYNDLADEVDQHFARALKSATTPMQSQGGPEALPKEHGRFN